MARYEARLTPFDVGGKMFGSMLRWPGSGRRMNGSPMADVKMTVRLNGPYWVDGPFELVDQDGVRFKVPEGERVALCRCGKSDNKPFCDSTHRNKTPNFDAPTRAS